MFSPLFPRGLRFSAKQARPPVVPAGPAKNKGGTQVSVPGSIVQFTDDSWCGPNQYKEWTQEMQAAKLNDPQRPGLRYELYQGNHDSPKHVFTNIGSCSEYVAMFAGSHSPAAPAG